MLAESLLRSLQAPHRVTTAHLGAAFPFMAPGGRVRLNPLDTRGLGEGLTAEEVVQDQVRVLYALAEAALGRDLRPVEHTACRAALAAASAQARWGQDPTLNEVVDLMLSPA